MEKMFKTNWDIYKSIKQIQKLQESSKQHITHDCKSRISSTRTSCRISSQLVWWWNCKILNGKVIPGDRVFYPVKPHIGTATPGVHQPDFAGKAIVFTVDATDKADAERVEFLAQHVEKNGGKVACFISQSTPTELQEYISGKFHSHVVDITNPEEVERWLNTAKTNIGEILAVIHVTGKLPEVGKLTELSRAGWEELIAKFISTPATVAQRALEQFVSGGGKDPRLYKDANRQQ